MNRIPRNKGLSFFEILIAVAVITLVSTLSISAFTSFRRAKAIDVTMSQTVSLLNKARHQTLDAKNGYAYGVRFNTDYIYLYQGSFSSSTPVQTVALDPFVKISAMNLAGGTNDVRFTRLTGETTATGTVSISLRNNTGTSTITIYQSGLVQ